MIINFTGQAGAGKTTLANALSKYVWRPIIIDGDELREIFQNKDYSEEGRRKNITNAYNIAKFLEHKGFTPIIALISPYKDLRDELKSQTNVLELYLHTDEIRGREHFFAKNYEAPTQDFLTINTSEPISECLPKIIMEIIKTR